MNYARAVKSGQVTEEIVNLIQSQSLIELGRELTGEEKQLLFSHIQPSALLKQINKVRTKLRLFYYFTLILVYPWCNEICSHVGLQTIFKM